MHLSEVKVKLNKIVGSLNSVYVFASKIKRGSTNTMKIPDNCIFIFTNGYMISNNISGTELNIILEGGNPNWDNSYSYEKYIPYYPIVQMQSLNSLLDYIDSFNPKITIRQDI